MRLLIASPVLPYPPTWGFATRVFHFVRLLARRHAVTVVAYGEPGDNDAIAHLTALGVAVHAVPRGTSVGTKRLEQLSSLVSPRSYQWRAMYSSAMQRTLREVMTKERFDLIQIESSQLAVFEYDARAVLVVDEHNISGCCIGCARRKRRVRRAYIGAIPEVQARARTGGGYRAASRHRGVKKRSCGNTRAPHRWSPCRMRWTSITFIRQTSRSTTTSWS